MEVAHKFCRIDQSKKVRTGRDRGEGSEAGSVWWPSCDPQPCEHCRSSHIRCLKPEANLRWPKRRKKRRASELPVLSCCFPRNRGERTLTWAFPARPLGLCFPAFEFFCMPAPCLGHTVDLTVPCRFLEGEDGEDTAKILQTDIVEAVDIASAAKVSLRREGGPGVHGWSSPFHGYFLPLPSTLT